MFKEVKSLKSGRSLVERQQQAVEKKIIVINEIEEIRFANRFRRLYFNFVHDVAVPFSPLSPAVETSAPNSGIFALGSALARSHHMTLFDFTLFPPRGHQIILNKSVHTYIKSGSPRDFQTDFEVLICIPVPFYMIGYV